MAGPDFYIAQGDTDSALIDTLQDANGDPVDIQGASIVLQLFPADGGASSVVAGTANNDQVGDGSDGSKGQVSYDWQASETDDAGDYFGTWVVTFGGGGIQTYPNTGPFRLQITPDTAAVGDAFATPRDLEDRLGVQFTADEYRRARGILQQASDLIRGEMDQHISLVEDDVLTRTGIRQGSFRLPERPVVEVSSITLNGETLDAGGYYVENNYLNRVGTGQNTFGAFGGFGSPTDTLVITYTHGYEDVPDAVKAICLNIAARAWVNPGAVVAQSIGSVQTTFSVAPVAGMELMDSERQALTRALGTGVGSVALR